MKTEIDGTSWTGRTERNSVKSLTLGIKGQPTRWKTNSEYSLEELVLKLKLQYFGHLMQRATSLEKSLMLEKTEVRRRKGWQRMRWLNGITNSVDIEFEQALGESEGQGNLACCSPWGCRVGDNLTTEQQPSPGYLQRAALSTAL